MGYFYENNQKTSQYVGYCLTVFMIVIFGVPPSECEKEMQNDK